MKNPKLLYNGFFNENIAYNNFQSFRIYIIAVISDFLCFSKVKWYKLKKIYIKQCRLNLNYQNYCNKHGCNIELKHCFRKKNIGFDFFHRSSILYHEYNLQALFYSGQIISKNIKFDYYNYIKKAVHALLPYYNHEIKHILYKHTQVESDKQKPLYLKTYVKEMSNKWLINDFCKKDEKFEKKLKIRYNL